MVLCNLHLVATAPAKAASPPQPRSAVVVALRSAWAAPAGAALLVNPLGPRSWAAGVDVAPDGQDILAVWLRRLWRLEPDTQAQVGVQAGFHWNDAAGFARGPWLGLYLGQRVAWGSWLVELGTELRVGVGTAASFRWESGLWTGFGW